jgi:hypothetical protein
LRNTSIFVSFPNSIENGLVPRNSVANEAGAIALAFLNSERDRLAPAIAFPEGVGTRHETLSLTLPQKFREFSKIWKFGYAFQPSLKKGVNYAKFGNSLMPFLPSGRSVSSRAIRIPFA